jgi:hypothetical protein
MEMIATLLNSVIWLLSWVFAIVWWIVSYLLWAIVWLILPFLVVGFIAMRAAEKILGPEVVRAWVKQQSLKFGVGTWHRARRWMFALTALPLRVLGWLSVYTIWHSVISLFWKPRWHPWTRAWGKRWKPRQPVRRSKIAKAR